MNKLSKLGDNISVDAQTLVDSRLLIQANSGGGKSYAIRKLIEATHGQLQQIILDVEGDFSSLREKFEFVLAGKGGDIPTSVKSASMLARKSLELETNLIVDLYELKHHERIRFVKLFLEEMINVPKNLWHPVLIVIDEAHLFAPEKGGAESMGAVIDICTRGRKRGFGAVLATQRLSKLHKDAAAECNNKLIGRTLLDIDVKRAADELGFTAKDHSSFRALRPGEFFAFGPAISTEVIKGSISKALTTHPSAGQRVVAAKPAMSSSKMKQALKELADLPQEAEKEASTIEELRNQVKELSRRNSPKLSITLDEEKVKSLVEAQTKVIQSDFQNQLRERLSRFSLSVSAIISEITKQPLETRAHSSTRATIHHQDKIRGALPAELVSEAAIQEKLSACESKILGFLASQPKRQFSKIQVGAMTGYAHSSGGFNNALSKLNQAKLIIRESGQVKINLDSQWEKHLTDATPHALKDWINKLGACERAIYELLLKNPYDQFEKAAIAAETNYSAGSGGFNNAISRLSTLGLIRRESGKIQINEELLGFT